MFLYLSKSILNQLQNHVTIAGFNNINKGKDIFYFT